MNMSFIFRVFYNTDNTFQTCINNLISSFSLSLVLIFLGSESPVPNRKSVDSFSFLHHPVHQRSLEILQRCKDDRHSKTTNTTVTSFCIILFATFFLILEIIDAYKRYVCKPAHTAADKIKRLMSRSHYKAT